jgi:VIT1/CCC1 family predicted Fe2+/Mn2+ transporter
MPHTTDNAAYAARLITRGPFKNLFWGLAVGLGGLLPLLLLSLAPRTVLSVAISSLLALGGLLVFEYCFVMAGQSVPNS